MSCCGGTKASHGCGCAACAGIVAPPIEGLEIPLDRVTFRNGQLLTASDLREDHRTDLIKARLHTRYLHATWGIALGLGVNLAADLKSVVVGPGYAVDMSGRDLLQADTVLVPLPFPTGIYALVARYRNDAEYGRPGKYMLCEGRPPQVERAALEWRTSLESAFGPEVPLAAVSVLNGVAQGALNLAIRTSARRMLQPYIATGETDANRTGWSDQNEGSLKGFWLQVNVDTSEAGFVRTPQYFAFLNAPDAPSIQAVAFISAANSSSFLYRIPRTSLTPGVATLSAAQVEQQGWTIRWLGLEPYTGCEPSPLFTKVFSVAGPLIGKVNVI
jgi:hypothetical protein